METIGMQKLELSHLSNILPLIQRFDGLKFDCLCPQTDIEAVSSPKYGLQFRIPSAEKRLLTLNDGTGAFDYTKEALTQIAELADVDKEDLRRGAEYHPEATASWINAWTHDEKVANKGRKRPVPLEAITRLVRAFKVDDALAEKGVQTGVIRAIRSDKFRLGLDVSDILACIIQVLNSNRNHWNDVDISASVTDAVCNFKLDNNALVREIVPGQEVKRTIYGATSDIGYKSFELISGITVIKCSNGARLTTEVRKAHIGSRLEELPDGAISDRTNKLRTATLLSETVDVMNFMFSDAEMDRICDQMRANHKREVKPESAKAIFQVVQQAVAVADSVKDRMFAQFLSKEKHTKDGVVQAVTAIGQEMAGVDYPKAIPFEEKGGRLIEMKPEEFSKLEQLALSDNIRQAVKMLN